MQDTLLTKAWKGDQETEQLSKATAFLLARHTRFALKVTLFQVDTLLAAIATLPRR